MRRTKEKEETERKGCRQKAITYRKTILFLKETHGKTTSLPHPYKGDSAGSHVTLLVQSEAMVIAKVGVISVSTGEGHCSVL